MPVFTLKSYDEKTPVTTDDPNTPAEEKPEPQNERTVVIQANDSVSKLVAAALYRTMSRVSEDSKAEKPADARVISTEDINAAPARTWATVRGIPNVVIVSEGFHTAKEEWFLSSLECAGVKVHYSVEGYLRTLGVKNKPSEE